MSTSIASHRYAIISSKLLSRIIFRMYFTFPEYITFSLFILHLLQNFEILFLSPLSRSLSLSLITRIYFLDKTHTHTTSILRAFDKTYFNFTLVTMCFILKKYNIICVCVSDKTWNYQMAHIININIYFTRWYSLFSYIVSYPHYVDAYSRCNETAT